MADYTSITVKMRFADIEENILTDLDTRLWFDDLVERIIQGRFHTPAWQAYLNDREQEEADIHQQGYDEGWSDRDDTLYESECPEDCCRE